MKVKTSENSRSVFANCVEVTCVMCRMKAIYIYHKNMDRWSCMKCHNTIDDGVIGATYNMMMRKKDEILSRKE